ncbi:MAG: DUF6585 family protein [Polyangiaceae bacterium]
MQPVPPQFMPGVAPQGPVDPQLGSVVSEWRAGARRRILLALVTLVFGGGLAAIGADNDSMVVVVIALVLTVLCLVLVFVQQGMVRVVSYTHGIERFGLFGKKRVLFEQLQSITLVIVDPAANVAGQGLLVVLIVRLLTKKDRKPQAVVLAALDNSKLSIPGYLKGYDDVLGSLLPYLTERLFAKAQYELSRGQLIPFGKRLVLDPSWNLTYTGLLGGKTVLPLNAVASAKIERGIVLIQPRDQKKPWQRIHARSMPNLPVFQRFVALVNAGAPVRWGNQ